MQNHFGERRRIMEQLLVLLGSFLLVSLCRGQVLCHEQNCPHFKPVSKTDDYEERLYEATDWITTKVENNDLWAANVRLGDYCKRQKAAGYNFAVDAWPVLITERPDGHYLSWYVPPGMKKPEDTDEHVKLDTRPAGTVYVKVFDGEPSMEKGKEIKVGLQKALDKALKDYDPSSSAGAGFEPFIYPTHHNEVWIQAADHN
ncbi:heme-binding protein soul2 isoform X1 [Xyrichtys novacula]|nr:heme-binding protein soul2 isoform X1 [Xyrichtys novacula]